MPPNAHQAIHISAASDADMPILANLFQLYRYDISGLRGEAGQDIQPDGRYPLPRYLADSRTDPRCAPFLVYVDGHLAGFVLVRAYSQLTGDQGIHDILEFFIMRKFRGRGVGTIVARRTFAQFPGTWEVREHRRNHPAQRFWRRVIADYTGGQYTEFSWDDARHRGIVQRFESAAQPSLTEQVP